MPNFTLFSREKEWNLKCFHSFREMKSEFSFPFTLFENEKWNENALRSRSRMKSEMKMPRDRDREVKFLENSREILENQEIHKISNFWSKCFSFSKLLKKWAISVISGLVCGMVWRSVQIGLSCVLILRVAFNFNAISTLIAYVWFLSAVCFQVCPQITCLRGCKVTLVAFVWLFSSVCFQMTPQIACLRRCKVTLAALFFT